MFKRKSCFLCKDKVREVDYKNVNQLRRYLSERGKIRNRRMTGACRRHQRQIAVAVKRAREMALLPYVSEGGGRPRGLAPTSAADERPLRTKLRGFERRKCRGSPSEGHPRTGSRSAVEEHAQALVRLGGSRPADVAVDGAADPPESQGGRAGGVEVGVFGEQSEWLQVGLAVGPHVDRALDVVETPGEYALQRHGQGEEGMGDAGVSQSSR